MSRTKMRAGHLVAVYVEDALGRRLVLGDPEEHSIDRTLVFARTQSEGRAVIAVLRQLLEKLPP